MQRSHKSLMAVAAALLIAAPALAQEESRAIEDGGIHVTGWLGRIDAGEAANGGMLDHSRLAGDADALQVTTGPAVVYWRADNMASGDYEVRATFNEPAYMNRNNHPHPYGLFIGGSDMGTDQQRLLYCAAYGNGGFIVRGFGPEPFQMNGRRAEMNDAVHKAAGPGAPVTQEIAMAVRGGQVSCSINGTTVASYPVGDVLGAGKLSSLDGIYGIRFGHNTEATVTGLRMER